MTDEDTPSDERGPTPKSSDAQSEASEEDPAAAAGAADVDEDSARTPAADEDVAAERADAESTSPAEGGAEGSADSEDSESLETEVEQLAAVVKDTRERIDELESKVEDYQRRNRREHEEIKKYAVEDLASEMLQVNDMLGDAIEMEDLEEGTERRLGVVRKQFDKILTSGSIERIEPEPREPYDDANHRMMEKVPTDEYAPERVVEVMEPGYRTHDRVIRPARVKVSADSR